MSAAPSSLLVWSTDAATIFVNGFISGLGAGIVVGGAAAANTDTLDPQTLSIHAAIGLLLSAAANGLKRVVIWHDSNPVPNPFRGALRATPAAQQNQPG
jgi:hypothetical protein